MSKSKVLREYSGTNEIQVLERDGNYEITKLIIYFLLLHFTQINE